MSNLKSKILAAKDFPHDTVEVPEWGVKVEMRGMSGTMRAKVVNAIAGVKVEGQDEEAAKMAAGLAILPLVTGVVAESLYDPETGERVFVDEADVKALGEKNGEVVQRLALKVFALSGLSATAVDDAGKSSSSTPSAASASS